MKRAAVLGLSLLLVTLASHAAPGDSQATAVFTQEPELLSFGELVELSSTPKPEGQLAARLDALLTTPFIQNDASVDGTGPHRPNVPNLGPVIRVGFWNIERGLNFDLIRSAFTDTNEFEHLGGSTIAPHASRKALVESQLAQLQGVNVLVLNEVDLGMKRTEYRNVAGELALALHMNYAYGVEFVEVDPVFALGIQPVHVSDARRDARLQKDLAVDSDRYRGLHGTAILSRYPIRSARIFRLPVCYDWYAQEAKEAAKLEKGKRWAARALFKERIGREVRQGGRMALIAELAIPELPTGEATVAAVHLENKCPPSCRRRQLAALLGDLKGDRNPVILAGDLNTTSKNNTPTSVRNEIMSRVTDYQFWIGQTVSYFNPLGIYRHALFPVHYFHGYNDPTAFHLPIVWDNRERPLFSDLEKFRFADGHAFDFRGDLEHAAGRKSRTLADSNARARKGFVPTYSFARDYGGLVGRFKLDWFFVKPFIADPRAKDQKYLFAPHFAYTMRELNESVPDRISDHAPMTVDLPLGELPN